ncbi:MAG: ABC transporter ATP-binding protein [Dehalococcoidales bacterium]|nr:MAG: ABC transporter ATP-binding protein [Dehalococcoidales bacterium]
MAIIETRHLTKKFKDLVAVDDLDLEIEEGECFGLLGPNGSGKTTLIRMITAVSPPTEGEIRVLGKDLKQNTRQTKAIFGVIPQIDNLDEDLTVLQNLTTFARYFSIPKDEAKRRSLEVLNLVQLEDKQNSKIDELSGGMKRRLLIARGLINQPEIVILDEPTVGLDPQAKHLVWQKLVELKAQGKTLLLCTQNMDEAEALCDRVAIMYLGKIVSQDTPRALISKHVGDRVLEIEVGFKQKEEMIEILTANDVEFADIGNSIEVFHTTREFMTRILGDFSDNLRERPATLEDVFFGLTGRALMD